MLKFPDCSSADLSRRAFLAATAAVTLSRPRQATAIEPFDRPTPGPLKLSVAAYSFRKELTSQGDAAAVMSLFNLVDFCREQQVPGVELTSYYFPFFDEARSGEHPEERRQGYLQSLARHCHRQGVSISGGAIRNDFCVAEEKLAGQVEAVKRWIDAYAILGAPVIRIFAGKVPKGDTEEAARQRCIRGCQLAADYAEQRGLMLALENHGGITATPDSMLPIVRGVDSPAFGVNFDSGNFRTADPYADLERIAPYAINAQIKVKMGPHGEQVDADLPRIVDILKHAGYGGWVALEYEESGDVAAEVARYLGELRPLLA